MHRTSLGLQGNGQVFHAGEELIDPNFKSCTPYELRTIDVFDGSSGKMMHQLYDPESSGIISVRLGTSNNGRKQGFNLLD